MSIQAIFSHIFVKRGFFGLIAFAWGFMLGGSVLMTALTYGLALAGLSRYVVMLYQIVVLVMLLPVAWGVMEHEYQKKCVTNIRSFGAAFLVALFFGAVMPIAITIGAFVTWLEVLHRIQRTLRLHHLAAIIRVRHLEVVIRTNTVFMQDLMDRSFLKLAH